MSLNSMNNRDSVAYIAPNNGVLIHDIRLANADHIPGVDSYVGRANSTLREQQLGLHFDFDSASVQADHASWEAIGLPVIPRGQFIGIKQHEQRSLIWSTIHQAQRDTALKRALQNREIFPFIRHKAFDKLANVTNGTVAGTQAGVDNWNNKNHVMSVLAHNGIEICPGTYVAPSTIEQAKSSCSAIVTSLYNQGFRGMAIKELDAVSGLGITKLGSAAVDDQGNSITAKADVSLEQLLAELEVVFATDEVVAKITTGNTRIEGWIGESVTDERFSGTVMGSPSIGMVIRGDGRHVYMGKDGTSDQLLENSVHCSNIYPSLHIEQHPQVQRIGKAVAHAAHKEGVVGPISVDLVVLQKDDGSTAIYPVETNCRFSGPTHGFALHHDWSRMHNLDSRDIAFGAGNLHIDADRFATSADLYQILQQDQWLATKHNVLNGGVGVIVANSAPLQSGKVHIVALATRKERNQIKDLFTGKHELNEALQSATLSATS